MSHRLQCTNIFLIAMLGMYFLVSTVVSSAIMVVPDMPYADSWMNMTIYLSGFFLPCIVYAILMQHLWNQPIKNTFSLRKLPAASVFLSILLGILIQPVSALLAQLASMFFTDITSSSVQSMTSSPLPLMIFSMALLPALFEEILCRGILYDGYKDAPLWYQILFSGAFFGMLHMNFQQISYALPMGIFLAIVLTTTHSIYSTMIIHFVMNGTQVTLSWLNENLGWFDRGNKAEDIIASVLCGNTNLIITSTTALIALVLIIVILLVMKKLHQTDPESAQGKRVPAPGWHKGAWILYLILGFLFMCSLLIELLMPLLQDFM